VGTGGASASGATGGVGTGGAAAGGVVGTGGAATGGEAAGGGVGTGGTTGGSATGGLAGDDPTCAIGVDGGSTPQLLEMSNVDSIHDPTIIKSGDRYYVYNSGIFTRSSTDLRNWQWGASSTTLKPNPSWTDAYTEGPNYDLWAPDVSYFGGQYHLYFAASSMGSQTSCLGHATRASMESGDFADSGGPILCSNVDTQVNWNAIDPNVVFDATGAPWLVFGSGWEGIEVVRLEQDGTIDSSSPITNIAHNSEVIEGATMVYRCGYYYLFLSWGLCCRGADSTYTIRVGRSTTLDGGFVDKNGVGLLDGGGTLLVSDGSAWVGPGGESVLIDGTDAYLVYHAYDAAASGNSFRMHISELFWDDTGWPVTAPTPP
jgi:arabinan endo-1,5-alpha-L-arabinosidase